MSKTKPSVIDGLSFSNSQASLALTIAVDWSSAVTNGNIGASPHPTQPSLKSILIATFSTLSSLDEAIVKRCNQWSILCPLNIHGKTLRQVPKMKAWNFCGFWSSHCFCCINLANGIWRFRGFWRGFKGEMERPHWKHLVLIWGFENWGFSVVGFFIIIIIIIIKCFFKTK